MDLEQDLWVLAGENMALKSVIIGLCLGIAKHSKAGRNIVEGTFDYADGVAEVASAKLAMKQPQAHLQSFVRAIDQLREATLGENVGPKVGV